jgi:hypothetical protein
MTLGAGARRRTVELVVLRYTEGHEVLALEEER